MLHKNALAINMQTIHNICNIGAISGHMLPCYVHKTPTNGNWVGRVPRTYHKPPHIPLSSTNPPCLWSSWYMWQFVGLDATSGFHFNHSGTEWRVAIYGRIVDSEGSENAPRIGWMLWMLNDILTIYNDNHLLIRLCTELNLLPNFERFP